MLSVGFKTDRGVVRSGNEDSLFVLPDQQLYIVADGVGGHNSGELASRLAVGYMAQFVALNPVAKVKSDKDLMLYFKACLEGANQLIFGKAQEEPDNRGMATTSVLCFVRNNKAYVVNVGDSRAYLIRDGVLRQVTKDHSYVNDMIESGMLTPEEAKYHPDRHMITRALGGEQEVKPDFFQFEVYKNDILILCTDGLYGELTEESFIKRSAEARTMHQLASDLVFDANSNGGKDNISVICIKVL